MQNILNWKLSYPEDYSSLFSPLSKNALNEFQQILERFNLNEIGAKKSFFYRTFCGIPFYWLVNPEIKSIELQSTITANYKESTDSSFATELELSIGVKNTATLHNTAKTPEFIDIVTKLHAQIQQYKPGIWERPTDWGLLLTAEHEVLRVHLLKFLAILPSLNHDTSGVHIKRMWLEALDGILSHAKTLPPALKLCIQSARPVSSLLPALLFTHPLRFLVKKMATRFVAADSMSSAQITLEELYKTNRCATIDQLGELVVSDAEAQSYFEHVLSIIAFFNSWHHKGKRNSAGLPLAHISLKVTALCARLNPDDMEYGIQRILPRLKTILIEAMKAQTFVQIDAEHYSVRDCVFKLYRMALLDSPELSKYADTGIVVQAYLKDSYQHLLDVIQLAKTRGLTMPIRLVKGAYWDAQTIAAQAGHFDSPTFIHKNETDGNFRFLVGKILDCSPTLQLCLASHNIMDHAYALSVKQAHFPKALTIEHQCLHMTYEALSMALAKLGLPVRNYVPLGDLLVGMAYLVRRIMENSSQVGFLSQMRKSKKSTAQELLDGFHHDYLTQASSNSHSDFHPAPNLRCFILEERETLIEEISNCKLSSIADISMEEARLKLDIPFSPFQQDTNTMQRVANIMLAQRNKLAAIIVHEGKKTPQEAIGDVNEAIDFVLYYSLSYANFQKKYGSSMHPRGSVAVIPPWNFPLAIPAGMVCAALVCGNRVFFKPANVTKSIAMALVEIFYQAGISKEQLIFMPGPGSTIGQLLLDDERISTYVFTGSAQVGQHLFESVTKRIIAHPILKTPLKVNAVTEMGGKNAIIITNNAELDEAITISLDSAFGHSGQKCSAASRILVDSIIAKQFIQRFISACKDLVVGPATSFMTAVNPLITPNECKRVRKIVQEIKDLKDGTILLDLLGDKVDVIGPVVVEISAEAALNPESWSQKEIFAPVVYIIPYSDLDQAIAICNSSCYGLTAGVVTQSHNDQEYLASKIQAGNIYVNRSCTGARVGIEPFGGMKLSGTGPKAGHADYLYSFLYFEQKDIDLHQRPTLNLVNNVSVPGQLSFNDYFLKIPEVIFIFSGALQSQSTIIWLDYVKLLNISFKMYTLQEFIQLQQQNPYFVSMMIIDVDLNNMEMRKQALVLFENYKKANLLKQLSRIFIAQDAFPIGEPIEFFKSLTNPRSLAINIMRHGAPLIS